MGIFSISYLLLDNISIVLILRNLFFVTLGNIVGGAVLLALPIKFMTIEDEDLCKNEKKLKRVL